jgi:hypothetical protein
MTFGNFLLGVAEGLDRGVEAGDRIGAAMDRKKVREAGKNVPPPANPATQAPAPINGKVAAGPPKPVGAGTPALVAGPAPAGTAPPPPAAPSAPRPSLQPTYAQAPAATMGAAAPPPTFNAQFPAGSVAQGYGVMGPQQQMPPGPYPYPAY